MNASILLGYEEVCLSQMDSIPSPSFLTRQVAWVFHYDSKKLKEESPSFCLTAGAL